MFQPGDFVVYGSSGVCRVIQVGALEGKSADPTPAVLHIAAGVRIGEDIHAGGQRGVHAPGHDQGAGPGVHPADTLHRGGFVHRAQPATLRIHYEASLQSHQCEELVRLIKGIRHKCGRRRKRAAKWAR